MSAFSSPECIKRKMSAPALITISTQLNLVGKCQIAVIVISSVIHKFPLIAIYGAKELWMIII